MKKLILLSLVSLVFVLSACNGKSGGDSNGSTTEVLTMERETKFVTTTQAEETSTQPQTEQTTYSITEKDEAEIDEFIKNACESETYFYSLSEYDKKCFKFALCSYKKVIGTLPGKDYVYGGAEGYRNENREIYQGGFAFVKLYNGIKIPGGFDDLIHIRVTESGIKVSERKADEQYTGNIDFVPDVTIEEILELYNNKYSSEMKLKAIELCSDNTRDPECYWYMRGNPIDDKGSVLTGTTRYIEIDITTGEVLRDDTFADPLL